MKIFLHSNYSINYIKHKAMKNKNYDEWEKYDTLLNFLHKKGLVMRKAEIENKQKEDINDSGT